MFLYLPSGAAGSTPSTFLISHVTGHGWSLPHLPCIHPTETQPQRAHRLQAQQPAPYVRPLRHLVQVVQDAQSASKDRTSRAITGSFVPGQRAGKRLKRNFH